MAKKQTVLNKLQADSEEAAKNLSTVDKTHDLIEEAVDGYDGTKIKYVPTPNFTDCNSSGTQLPINMVSETVNNLSRLSAKENLTEYVMRELGYNSKLAVCMAFSSEQVDAIVMIIEQLKRDRAFILGDMAGIGKGRVLAGIQRWCNHNNIIGAFLTFQSNLFSEMYKDVMDIHGFGEITGGKYVQPKPFILNNAQSDPDAIIVNELNEVVYEPESQDEIKRICRSGKLPKKYNSIWMTYSQIFASRKERGSDENVKHSFLRAIAPRCVFLFDESHIAATGENTIIGEFSRELIAAAKGATFASATYAKNPKAFGLYVIKTALNEAQIPMDELEDAITVGGENVSEYIASAMVKEGQMLRRERSYAGCEISTVYKNPNVPLEQAKGQVYETFDNATAHFRDLLDYLKSDAFRVGINNAVIAAANRYSRRYTKEIELVDEDAWGIRPAGIPRDDVDAFLRENNGKYVPYVDYDTIGATAKFNFKESLFLAVKAELAGDAILRELKTRQEYTYLDGKKHLTNRKPFIATRSTLESIFKKMDAGADEIIQNDFSEYTKAIIKNCEKGTVFFRKVCPEFFNYSELSERQKAAITISDVEYKVRDTDLEDNGVRLGELRDLIENYSAGIPLSTIDYLRDRIETQVREDWDSINPDNPTTKNPSKTFVFGEVTGRNKMLLKVDGGWKLAVRNKESIKSLFNGFNNGLIDALLVNASGSTGQSAHSSIKFPDQRPRVMACMQFHLNINTEVQVRGRIHRTGQVNLPAYMYLVSLIPAEIRNIVALRSKMRKLDANTSANQVQSSDMVDIKDRFGNPIEDIYNKYGVEAFVSEFINLPDNDYYREIYERDIIGRRNELYADEDTLIRFSREMDYQRSSYQEDFYDQMNQKYREIVEKHKEMGDYQLEIETENLKAALKARAVVGLGEGSTEFSKPLFLEDKYTLEQRKTLTKEKIAAKVAELCEGKRPDKWHEDFLDSFRQEYDRYIESVLGKRREGAPDRAKYPDDESYDEALEAFEQALEIRRNELEIKKSRLSNRRKGAEQGGTGILDFFTPNKACLIPSFVIGMQEKAENDDATIDQEEAAQKAAEELEKAAEKKLITTKGNEKDDDKREDIPARFIGYKFLPTGANNKYSDASIELHFALLNGTPPILKLKPSKNYRALKYIMEEGNWLTGNWGGYERKAIDEWKFDPNKRFVRRFLSGNILSAIVRANKMQATERFVRYAGDAGKKMIRNWGLVRYTNYDGSVSVGIKLDYGVDDVAQRFGGLFQERVKINDEGEEVTEATSRVPVTVPVINEGMLEYIKLIPAAWRDKDWWSGVAPMKRGLIKVVRPYGETDYFELHVYTGMAKAKGKGTSLSVITREKDANYNKYYFDQNFQNILQPRYATTSNLPVNVEGKARVDKGRMMSAKVYRFTFGVENHAATFKRAMQYLWNAERMLVEFKADASDYYAVTEMEDVFNPKDKASKTERLFEFGEYEYMRTAPADPLKNPPMDLIVSEDEGKGLYGSVTLNLPIEPTIAITYNMYPLNLPNDVAVKLYLAMFDEQERARLKKELKEELIEKEKKSNYDIGAWAKKESEHKVPDLKFIFGSKNSSQIGEIFRTFITSGDLDKLVYEVQEETVTPAEVKKKKSVDYEGAEKYLIGMLS